MKTNIFKIVSYSPGHLDNYREDYLIKIFFNDIVICETGDYNMEVASYQAKSYLNGFIQGAKYFGFPITHEIIFENF